LNTIVWILAGAALAWLAFSYLDFNRNRGLMIALVIGAVGAYFGGSIVTPLLQHAAVGASDEFRPFALVVAMACASACLFVGDRIYERFGV
jgi:uncharacterized membrane protein YeaQ/YmgE (transglycosylase-associated protein family)